MKKALILDRDGTLIEDRHYLNNYKKIKFLPDNIIGLNLFQKKNFFIFIVSNQSGVARGLIKKEELKKINAEITYKLHKKGIIINKIYNCTHHPDSNCKCRKPNIFFGKKIVKDFKISLKKSIMIGNNICDKEFAKKLKIKYFNIGDRKKDFSSIYEIGKKILI